MPVDVLVPRFSRRIAIAIVRSIRFGVADLDHAAPNGIECDAAEGNIDGDGRDIRRCAVGAPVRTALPQG